MSSGAPSGDSDDLRPVPLQVELDRLPEPTQEAGLEIVGTLGAGGQGQVLLAFDPVLQRQVALKRLDPDAAPDPTAARRLRREVQVTAQLEHPGIVPVFGAYRGRHGGIEYAMRVVRGDTLRDLLEAVRERARRGQPVGPERDLRARLEIFVRVCDAVAHAHGAGVIHRDLKPTNVMLGAGREVLVLDWGLAKAAGGTEPVAEGEEGTHMTADGQAIGSPRYMSPEQGRCDDVDARSDQYALGLILFELVTLRPAIEPGPLIAVVVKVVHGRKEPWRHLVPRTPLPRALEAVVARATAKEPDQRYPDVAALAADVRRFLRDEPVSAYHEGLGERAQRWVSRHRRTALLLPAAMAVAALLALAALSVAAVVSVEATRLSAAARADARADQLAVAAGRAQAIDAELLRFEGLVRLLAGAAEVALQRPAPPAELWLPEAMATAPGLVDARYYGLPSSLEVADQYLPPGADLEVMRPQLDQLATLEQHLLDTLLLSLAPDAPVWPPERQRDAVLQEGAPVVWTYVATEQGGIVGIPANGDFEDGYDPRAMPWYAAGRTGWGPRWSSLAADESGMGLLLTCSAPLRARDGSVLGVAALDLAFAWVVEELLHPAELGGGVEAFLIDGAGLVVVRSSQRDTAREVTRYTPEPFPWSGVLPELQARPRGFAVSQGREVVWARLAAVPWTYALVEGGP